MTSASSRRSFYPLPPSIYPQPLVDPCAAFETTYGHEHCSHSVRDDSYFRSRTLNPAVSARQTQSDQTGGSLAHANQGIYTRHGTGQFIIPYYRRDSKGYRRSYEQPAHVDENYTARRDVSGLVQSGYQWAHPSSRPTYSASRAASVHGPGAVFSTSYRNSGLYDSSSTNTSRVAREVAHGLQLARSQEIAKRPATAPMHQSGFGELGYYTGEVRDHPPPQAVTVDPYANRYAAESNLAEPQPESNSTGVYTDPLPNDAFANAYRKSRTVYKRSFGKCQ